MANFDRNEENANELKKVELKLAIIKELYAQEQITKEEYTIYLKEALKAIHSIK